MIKVLNLYSGIGGNRKLWPSDKIDVTAIELNPKIAKAYQDFFPQDKVIVGEAHEYLLNHFNEFDFIWSSPPCPTHSRLVTSFTNNPIKYPDMNLYEEVLLLKHHFKGKWVVENVISYYKPLIRPFESGMHYFWSNFVISNYARHDSRIHYGTVEELESFKGFKISDTDLIDKRKILRNCVHPKLGLHVFRSAFNDKQVRLI